MKKEELYNKTVDILVQAYFNDTLKHGLCTACAVGNIVQATGGFTNGSGVTFWDLVFTTNSEGLQYINEKAYTDFAKKEIDQTGYKWQELAFIERAFEACPKGGSDDEYMFNGLMAVIEALDIIHENTNRQITIASKQRFVRAV